MAAIYRRARELREAGASALPSLALLVVPERALDDPRG